MALTQVNSKGIKDSEIVDADIASNANIAISKINTGSLSIDNSNVSNSANIDQSKINLAITNSEVASNANIDLSKINIGSLSIDNSNVSSSANIDLSKINLSTLSVTNSQVASNANIDLSKINIGSLSIDNSNVSNSAAIAQSKLNLAITDSEVASGANINASKLLFQYSGTSTTRTVAAKFEETISVTDYGAVANNESSATTNKTAIQAALNAAAGKANLYLPKGTFFVDGEIRIPSNTYFFGHGEGSIIKMKNTVDNITTLVRTGERNQKRKNIVIEDMTLDFNRERWQYRDPSQSNYFEPRTNNASGTKPVDNIINDGSSSMPYGGDAEQDYWGCTLSICFSENVLIKNVRALDGYKHTIDITSPKYRRSNAASSDANFAATGSNTSTPQIYDTVLQTGNATKVGHIITVTKSNHGYEVGDEIFIDVDNYSQFEGLYKILTAATGSFTVRATRSGDTFSNQSCRLIQDQGSKYVTLQNCYATGAGDDNITTHFSSDILITGCHSEYPSGRLVPQNSNCFEIDDGSRNVTLTNCVANNGEKGLQIKGHRYAPAPYNIIVDGLRITNCGNGLDIKHQGWGALASANNFANMTNAYSGGGTTSNPNHQIRSGNITYVGSSPTAKNVSISNVQIIAPTGFIGLGPNDDGQVNKLYTPNNQVHLYAYENVVFTNIMITEGTFDLAGDFQKAFSSRSEYGSGPTLEADSSNGSDIEEVVRVYYGASHVSFKNLAIHGFRNADEGIQVSSTFLQHFALDGFICSEGPNIGADFVETTGNFHATIDNWLIGRSGSVDSNSRVIRDYKLGTSFHIGNGAGYGYGNDNAVERVDP